MPRADVEPSSYNVHPVSESIEQILAHELGKLGAAGVGPALEMASAIADAVGAAPIPGTAEAAMRRGALRGAEFAARRMPNNVFQAEVHLPLAASTALGIFAGALQDVGRSLTGDPGRPNPTVRGVVMAGARNMNPAVVEVEVVVLGASESRVILTGTAKEGLIKQRAGEKAVRAVLAAAGAAEPNP